MQDGKFADSFQEMTKKAREMTKYYDAKRARSNKTIKINMYETLEENKK
jgi:hypothetical protein